MNDGEESNQVNQSPFKTKWMVKYSPLHLQHDRLQNPKNVNLMEKRCLWWNLIHFSVGTGCVNGLSKVVPLL